MKKQIVLLVTALLPLCANAQSADTLTKYLTLEDCRRLAVENNESLQQARVKVEMAGYDRDIARANYFPNISAMGGYIHNSSNIHLLDSDTEYMIANAGTVAGEKVTTTFTDAVSQLLATNPELAQQIMSSSAFQAALSKIGNNDLTAAINQIGSEVESHFEVDISNIWAAGVTVTQPVFVGGKILAANRMAKLAEDLAKSQYDMNYQQTLADVDEAYWQIVSVANKKKLAENYSDLLHNMEKTVDISIAEGVATKADGLQVKVKANEADMTKTQANNGLVLAKMLLCKRIGLPLNSDIILADETLDAIPEPVITQQKDMEQIYLDRPETHSLDLATQIYDAKVDIARADMMPKVLLVGAYTVSNPNPHNGFTKEWGGMFSGGVMVQVPIFHGFEALSKTRKAKAEASLYQSQLNDAKNLINLQVTQLREQQGEAYEKLHAAESNLESAEENLRTATIGFNEGVIDTNTALAAQTAWLQAHSQYIDAGIELQMNNVKLRNAQGENKPQPETAK